MQTSNKSRARRWLPWLAIPVVLLMATTSLSQFPPAKKKKAMEGSPPVKTSYDQIAPALVGQESFQAMMAKDKADKPAVMQRQKKLLDDRYDLSTHPDQKVTMTRGKPIQVGPAAKLPEEMTWDKLADMSPEDLRDKGLFP